MVPSHLQVSWTPVPTSTLVAYDRLLGQRVSLRNGVYWRTVRPCFFRPIMQFRPLASSAAQPPPSASIGGFQHAVPPGEPANSRLNLLVFANNPNYSERSLDRNRRHQVRQAASALTVRPLEAAAEWREHGHAVYCDFQSRTGYTYGTRRRDPRFFASWADGVAALTGLVVLGGFQGDRLAGLCVSMRIDDTLVYVTSFCDTAALRLHLSDLMLHTVRQAAASCPGIRRIYAGTHRDARDNFYLLRGAQCVSMPARLRLNPLLALALPRIAPNVYRQMVGGDQPGATDAEWGVAGLRGPDPRYRVG